MKAIGAILPPTGRLALKPMLHQGSGPLAAASEDMGRQGPRSDGLRTL